MSVGRRFLLYLTLFIALIAAFMGGFALSRENTLVHPEGQNPSGNPTTVYYSFGAVTGAHVDPSSTDTSGSVLGILSGTGTFEVIIHFSQPYVPAPKAVILQAPTPPNAIPNPNYLLTIENINESGFEMIGFTPTTQVDGVLFYYIVL